MILFYESPNDGTAASCNADLENTFVINYRYNLTENPIYSSDPGGPSHRRCQLGAPLPPDGLRPSRASSAGLTGVLLVCFNTSFSALFILHSRLSGSCPVFAPLSEVPNETLPACFLLRLKPPVPMLTSFVEELSLITG